jgi:hypothetical protein
MRVMEDRHLGNEILRETALKEGFETIRRVEVASYGVVS